MAKQVKKVPISKKGGKTAEKKDGSKSHSAKHDHHSDEKKGHAHHSDEAKEHAHTQRKERRTHRRTTKPWVSRTVLLILLLAAASFFVYEEFLTREDRGPIAATVNGERIYVSEVEEHFQNIPEQMRMGMTREVVLDQIISQEVLIQEADRRGITVSDEEIDEELDFAMAQAGWTAEEFEQVLAAQGMSKDDLRELYRVSIVIDNLIQEEVLERIEATDDDVIEFFEQNKEMYMPGATEVRAQHVLISTEDRDDDEALSIAEEVRQRALDGDDFTELVAEYSEDPSAVQNDGDLGYFAEGQMVPEFEEAVFAMEEMGGISEIIQTDFGYHVVKLIDRREAGEEPVLEEIFERVEEDFLNELRSRAVEEYIMELRDSADIEKQEVEEIDLPEQEAQQPGAIEISEEDLEAMQEGDDGMEIEIQ